MNRMQRLWKPILAIALTIVLLLGGTTIAQARKIGVLNHQVWANHARALYEGAELLRSAEVNLRKLTVSASGAQLQTYLNDIARQAQGAESAISALPFAGEPVLAAAKAINQIGDYSVSLSARLARGGAITDEDIHNIDQLIDAASAINASLSRMIDQFEASGIVDSMEFEAVPFADTNTSEVGEYPTLIYDGPFSDASDGEIFHALGTERITAEQAQQTLLAYVGIDRIDSVHLERESDIPIQAYEFALQSGEMELSAAVTKQGGQVLYILPDSNVISRNTDVRTCIANAKQFLQRNGYDDMAISYYYEYQNILTINFSATQNGVLLYPDLVKVQVSMEDGNVIGVECANYLKNHVARELPEPLLSEEDALQRINTELTPEFVRLALIPVNSREILTYEVAAKDGYDNKYLIYIDAVTGQERQIYQLISTENGTLVE